MKALNKAFEKAFLHSEGNDNIADLLASMGEEMGCERISIFEENEEGTYDNTYEWCRPGIAREQILLQHVSVSTFDTWQERLARNEIIVVHYPEELKEHDPDVYELFISQNIHSAIVSLLAFHGRNFGFCILEDPDEEVMADKDVIMPGIRYILSSMIYSRNLVNKLRRLGYTDTLTGVGNRVSLKEHLEEMDYKKTFGAISIDVVGWDNDEGHAPHLEKEQTLLRAGETLRNIYDEEQVFRVATGEFVVIESGADRDVFEARLHSIRSLFREQNLLAAVSGDWTEKLPGTVDAFIHDVHQTTEAEKKVILTHRKAIRHHAAVAENEDNARITIPKGDEFFRLADQFLSDLFEESVVSLVIDINYFKLYNDIFGRRAGNVFLENIASLVKDAAETYNGFCGYTGGDNFCLLLPTHEKDVHAVEPMLESLYQTLKFPDGFSPALGVYLSEDRREPSITLYDKALGALSEIKGDYIRHIAFYSDEMNRHQREDKMLLMNVKSSLAKEEFIFYVQPQVNERSEKIIGGEALVRWLHEGQLIPPGRFIPVLEKTGYVYAVDSFVWESVAKWLRSLIDRGIQPVPISVNVSRVDFYFADIADQFIGLVEKYDLTPDLIGIEITETAFTDNTNTIKDAIRKLHAAGFHILMDDFGSGSSSLSMLHTMHLDVLKTDVQFMSKHGQDNRAISIVESVISMAHLIGMTVVTEGVETKEQKESLIALGENFAQGYYFYKPMPKEEFEALIADPENVTEGYSKKNLYAQNGLKFRDMIMDGLVSETLLDNILRAAAVYKEQNGVVSIVQLNKTYSDATGITLSEEIMENFSEHLEPEEREKLIALLRHADTHPLGGSEGTIRLKNPDGSVVERNMRVFLLYSLDDHKLYLSTMG